MRNLSHLDDKRVRLVHDLGELSYGNDEHNGCFVLPNPRGASEPELRVIATDGQGWDHVSVSTRSRTPTWEEMAFIRDLFFEQSEIPVQFGPPRALYVNVHPYCLHWWRNQSVVYDLPPIRLV